MGAFITIYPRGTEYVIGITQNTIFLTSDIFVNLTFPTYNFLIDECLILSTTIALPLDAVQLPCVCAYSSYFRIILFLCLMLYFVYKTNVCLSLPQIWPQGEYPLIPVGRMVLNRNPANYFAEVEQSAFCPAHFVPGNETQLMKLFYDLKILYRIASTLPV